MEIETKKYYLYPLLNKCLEFVRDFAKNNDLILVGGLSLDYSFRVYDRKIYEEWALPDFDFVSNDNVNISYKLFEEINKFLFGRALDEPQKTNVSVITATHPTTMKVLIFRDPIADITYLPNPIYEMYRLSAINHNGMMVRHPFMQCIDTQRSFSYPYENPMMEVVTSRWKKDYSRFNMTMEIYDPSNKSIVAEFVNCYAHKSKNGPPSLAKMGTGIMPNGSNEEKYSATSPALERAKMHRSLVLSEKKEILPFGLICGELGFLIYHSLYRICKKKKPKFEKFITGSLSADKMGLYYTGSHYFNNSYIVTESDMKLVIGYRSVVAKHQKLAKPFIDMLPSKIVSDGYEFYIPNHKTCYHNIDFSHLGYSQMSFRVVSFNYIVMQIVCMWLIFKHDMYLSLYLKCLRMLKYAYSNSGTDLLYPAIEPYGEEFAEQKEVSDGRPESIHVNEYVPPLAAIAKIKPYAYPDYYNNNGM